jgi:hypothetical protein
VVLVGIWTLEGWDVGEIALCARVRRSCHVCLVERTEGGEIKGQGCNKSFIGF